MSINYQELVPEKALGKEISRHIFQTYRAKTGLPHEIGLRYFIFNTASVHGDKIAARPPSSHDGHPTKSESLQDILLQRFAFIYGQEARRPYYSWLFE